ncbi:hypothetical protein [Paraburkholderia sediminicola]|uniref:hypothetical protein n=1 Tax=Paraburkholderia sediminicola TaxID=458836 RepID=UPI0038BA3E26
MNGKNLRRGRGQHVNPKPCLLGFPLDLTARVSAQKTATEYASGRPNYLSRGSVMNSLLGCHIDGSMRFVLHDLLRLQIKRAH